MFDNRTYLTVPYKTLENGKKIKIAFHQKTRRVCKCCEMHFDTVLCSERCYLPIHSVATQPVLSRVN